MRLLILIVVFLLEQAWPLDYARWISTPFAAWAGFLEKRCNAGDYGHGVLAGAIAILAPVGIVGAAWWSVNAVGKLSAFLLGVAVLYCVMGFRQFSHFYTDVQIALRLENIDRARDQLGAWRGETLSRCGIADIARISIETALVAAHRHVFAILFWFALLGPVGAVLYRCSHLLAETWTPARNGEVFSRFARQWFAVVDWLPARVTAMAFAVVGNFEDAVYCWRHQATRWRDAATGVVLASGGGALGVRLGLSSSPETPEDADLFGTGAPADVEFMQGAIGLVWRAIALWLLVLCVLGLVRLTS
ncbi:MAG: CobD/CbiB family protein [Zoogloeaceae bacterium]|jgi:cobalamin biosynthesis protein CobD/CbiB|nr:CobD/CbiB family protein [Zoogloeaceae bacterium]